ncbi:MAG: protein kinase [bacterium]|nr:protein kinase [bacterium]
MASESTLEVGCNLRLGFVRTTIKILENMRMSRRFRREMDLVQKLAHPNIVTAYEVDDYQGIPYIAMELLEGPDLNALVEQAGRLAWLESTRAIVQISRALVHAHERELTHRDIKPGNILRNGRGCVKLVDLGLAAMRRTGDETDLLDATQEAQVAGTLPFMAPEQASSLTTADKQSDIYSLGATWFYLLTGKSRLPGKTLAEQFSNLLVTRKFRKLPDDRLPVDLMRIYERMVAYSPADRYTSTRQLNYDLECGLRSCGYSVLSNKITVLVIEDSQLDMLRTLEILRKTNTCLSLHQATTLREGLNVYRYSKIDLALLDLTLPDSDGIETVRRFRKVAPEVPVVVLSGNSDPSLFEACLQAGCSGFIPKFELTAHKIERLIFVTLSKASSPSVSVT